MDSKASNFKLQISKNNNQIKKGVILITRYIAEYSCFCIWLQ